LTSFLGAPMTRAVKEGDDPRLMAPEAERSDYQSGSSLPKVSVQKVEKQSLPCGVRFKAAKVRCLSISTNH
jgi:hypothetical protein